MARTIQPPASPLSTQWVHHEPAAVGRALLTAGFRDPGLTAGPGPGYRADDFRWVQNGDRWGTLVSASCPATLDEALQIIRAANLPEADDAAIEQFRQDNSSWDAALAAAQRHLDAAGEERRKAARATQQAALLAEFAAESERERETGPAAAVYVHLLPRD